MASSYEDLLERVHGGRAILILGQEHLAWADGVTLDRLVDPLLKALGERPQTPLRGLSATCAELLKSDRISPERLMAALHRASETLEVPIALRDTLALPWRAVFTTAIDDVLSRALASVADRSVRVVFDSGTRVTQPRSRDNLYVFRLLGAVDQTSAERVPIFGAEGERQRRRRVRELLRHLEDVVGIDGILVFAGLSPASEERMLLISLWEHIGELDYQDCLWFDPPRATPDSREFRDLLAEGVVTLVRDRPFARFVDDATASARAGSAGTSVHTVMTPHGPVSFDRTQWRLFRQHMVVLDKGAVEAKQIPRTSDSDHYERFRKFLSGEGQPDWSAHASGFVFARPEIDKVETICLEDLEAGFATRNRVVTVSGPSGAGKTIILEHVAWKLACKGHPVIYIPKRSYDPDFKIIELFCSLIQPRAKLERGASDAVRSAIVWDAMGADTRRYEQLASYLASRGRAALVVGACYRASTTPEAEAVSVLARPKNEPVAFRLDDAEAKKFMAFLDQIDPELVRVLKPKEFLAALKDDFLVALYDFLPATRQHLMEGLDRQYTSYEDFIAEKLGSFFQQKPSRWRDLLPLVFVASRFGLYPNIELVLRELRGPSHENYIQLWLEQNPISELEDFVLAEESDGVLRLKARHSRIAQICIRRNCTSEQESKYVARLAFAANPHQETEVEFLRGLFGAMRETEDKGIPPLDPQQIPGVIEVLEKLRLEKGIEDADLLHTEAILRRREAGGTRLEFEERLLALTKARDALLAADELLEKEPVYLRRVKERQNVANSLATVYRDMQEARLERVSENPSADTRAMREALDEDERSIRLYCGRASVGVSPNSYPTHVLVLSLLDRYKLESRHHLSEEKRTDLVVEMLDHLDRAEQDFQDQNLELLLQLRMRVYNECISGSDTAQQQVAERLLSRGSLAGYYVLAQQRAYKFDRQTRRLAPKGTEALAKGIATLRAETIPDVLLRNDARCLSLMTRMWWDLKVGERISIHSEVKPKLSTTEWAELRELLAAQLAASGEAGTRYFIPRFLYAWALLQEGQFEKSMAEFRMLESVSAGSRVRPVFLSQVTEQDGAARTYTGEANPPTPYTKHGRIYCRELRGSIPYSEYMFNSPPPAGEQVRFTIRLNFRGPMAVQAVPQTQTTEA